MKSATVPLNIAEFLRVTLQIAKQSDSLSAPQKAQIGKVLAMYEIERDEYLLNQGFTPKQIAGAAQSAGLALANYFEDQGNKAGIPVLDLDMSDFEREWDDHPKNS